MNFDRVADIYDSTRAIPEPELKKIADCIASVTLATPETRFLEIGVGTGRIALPIARQGYDYTGIDISEGMMRVLRAKSDAEGVNITLVNGDITQLPFPDGSFDVVIAVHVLHLTPEWRTALDEAWRVLAANGTLVIGSESESGTDVYSDIRGKWTKLVREMGTDVQPRHGTWGRLEEALTEQGCYIATYRAAHWEEDFIPAQLLEAQRARTFSSSWDLPDDVLQTVYDRMMEWGAERIGDMTAPQRDSEDFLVMVAPKLLTE